MASTRRRAGYPSAGWAPIKMGTRREAYLVRTSQRRASAPTRQMGLFQQPASAALRYFSAARAAMVPSAMAVVRYL